jgi:DNA-binding transcriptional regulator YdaS (Cro superfamily)
MMAPMKLNRYIKKMPLSERVFFKEKLAKRLGISLSYVVSMINGNRKIQEKYVVLIEKATKGVVKREELIPYLYKKYHKNK